MLTKMCQKYAQKREREREKERKRMRRTRAVAMMVMLVARAIGRCGADANVTKITPFPIGSPCYANYQCTKNVAFCEKAAGILGDTSTGDDENVYAYRALEYKYRVEAECGLYGYDKENFMDLSLIHI